jgi:hypothetical protein
MIARAVAYVVPTTVVIGVGASIWLNTGAVMKAPTPASLKYTNSDGHETTVQYNAGDRVVTVPHYLFQRTVRIWDDVDRDGYFYADLPADWSK